MLTPAQVSRLCMGIGSDYFSPHLLGAGSALIAAISVVVLWGVASTSMLPLIAFSVVFGIFASGWSSLFLRVAAEFSGRCPSLALIKTNTNITVN